MATTDHTTSMHTLQMKLLTAQNTADVFARIPKTGHLPGAVSDDSFEINVKNSLWAQHLELIEIVHDIERLLWKSHNEIKLS